MLRSVAVIALSLACRQGARKGRCQAGRVRTVDKGGSECSGKQTVKAKEDRRRRGQMNSHTHTGFVETHFVRVRDEFTHASVCAGCARTHIRTPGYSHKRSGP